MLALEIPPLRERREDIAVIAEYHCKRLCRTYGHPFGGFSAEALRVMEDYDWPGNVRQLVHSVEFAVNMPNREFSSKDKMVMERAANTCGVHHSLHPDVEQVFTFRWND